MNEWRVAADVGARADQVAREARGRLPADTDVHASGQFVYACTTGEGAASAAGRAIEGAAAAEGLAARIRIERWNPGAERWQHPSLPIERRAGADFVSSHPNDPRFEVRVTLRGHADARLIAEELREEWGSR